MKFRDQDWADLQKFVEGMGGYGDRVRATGVREGCERYLELLLKKNEAVNLTAIRDAEGALWKHFADSLALLALEPLGKMVDWGSGGGFPGIPLAIVRKESGVDGEIVFVDSVGKKVRAVEEFCGQLGLTSSSFFHARGEVLLESNQLRDANTVVMRAVAPADRAVQWVDKRIPRWVFFLGPQQVDEWKKQERNLSALGMAITQQLPYSLPHGTGERVLLVVSRCST